MELKYSSTFFQCIAREASNTYIIFDSRALRWNELVNSKCMDDQFQIQSELLPIPHTWSRNYTCTVEVKHTYLCSLCHNILIFTSISFNLSYEAVVKVTLIHKSGISWFNQCQSHSWLLGTVLLIISLQRVNIIYTLVKKIYS